MLPLESIHELYRQMEWADAATWEAVMTAPAEHDAELVDRLYHIHFTQRAFLILWTGAPRLKYDPKSFRDQGVRVVERFNDSDPLISLDQSFRSASTGSMRAARRAGA